MVERDLEIDVGLDVRGVRSHIGAHPDPTSP
jgi:hypothetical protein